MTFHSLSIFCRGRVLSLYSTSYLATQARNSFFDCSILNYIKHLSRYVLIEKKIWSVMIYLYRSWCSICKQLHRGLSLEKLLSNTPLCFSENSTSFLIYNMSFTYTYQKWCNAPTHFLVNTGFTASLYKLYALINLSKYIYSNSEMLAPVHRWISGACTIY